MRHVLAALLLALCLAGCTLSKEDSTLAKIKPPERPKAQLPAGFLTEDQVGVKFYPGADYFNCRQYDEGGNHIIEVGLNTKDDTDKVRDFYEKETGGKGMPTTAGMYSIEHDANGKHYSIGYGRFDTDTNIMIKVSWPTG